MVWLPFEVSRWPDAHEDRARLAEEVSPGLVKLWVEAGLPVHDNEPLSVMVVHPGQLWTEIFDGDDQVKIAADVQRRGRVPIFLYPD